MADWIPYLVPTQFPESIFPSVPRPKIPTRFKYHQHARTCTKSTSITPDIFLCCPLEPDTLYAQHTADMLSNDVILFLRPQRDHLTRLDQAMNSVDGLAFDLR